MSQVVSITVLMKPTSIFIRSQYRDHCLKKYNQNDKKVYDIICECGETLLCKTRVQYSSHKKTMKCKKQTLHKYGFLNWDDYVVHRENQKRYRHVYTSTVIRLLCIASHREEHVSNQYILSQFKHYKENQFKKMVDELKDIAPISDDVLYKIYCKSIHYLRYRKVSIHQSAKYKHGDFLENSIIAPILYLRYVRYYYHIIFRFDSKFVLIIKVSS